MIKTAYPVSHYQCLLKTSDFFTVDTLNNSFIFEFSNNEFIQHEGNAMNFVFFILQGQAKILKTEENGKRIIIQFIKLGDFIGDLTLVKAEKETKDVVSMGKTICLAIPMKYAQTVLLADIAFLQKISRYIGEKLLYRMAHFSANQAFELKYQLAELLLTVSIDNVYKEKHTEIAEYLGVSYRHLLYTFQQFREWQLIKKQGSFYLIYPEKINDFLESKKK